MKVYTFALLLEGAGFYLVWHHLGLAPAIGILLIVMGAIAEMKSGTTIANEMKKGGGPW